MTGRLRGVLRVVLTLSPAFFAACGVTRLQRQLIAPADLQGTAGPYLKAHMKSGDLFILSDWKVDSSTRTVTGTGRRYDRDRLADSATHHVLPLDSVALFESNVTQVHPSIAALVVVSTASAALTVACLSDPKACFGSCPTFYAADDSTNRLQAEGFSASVAPALEATDIDALYRVRPSSTRFALRMTNEALETHVVRWVKLLAAERPDTGRVYATQNGTLWASTTAVSPTRCSAAEGDCLEAVRALDDRERFSVTDSTDLAAREVIDLEFPPIPGDTTGIVIGSRQTLLSTFVLYQTLAFMGRNASAWLAALETSDRVRDRGKSLARILGPIEVQAQSRDGRWKTVGETQETGPLATDVRVVVLNGVSPGTTRLRLRLTKGHWRIDYVALARLDHRVRPLVLDPTRVLHRDVEDPNALARLRDSARALVALPGDKYTLEYALPEPFERYELFLESRGYYLEWMRSEWLAEENPARAADIFLHPSRAMRELAPAFKRQEARMESAFWNSRYARR